MGGSCTTRGEDEKGIPNFTLNTLRVETSGSLRQWWDEDIEMDL
jgi:hypothetical protein